MTRAPCSAAISATIGAAPLPVPPPMPARRKTRSQSFTTAAIFSRSASAASPAELGIAARAQAAGDAHADQDLVLDGRARQRLMVGVDHRQLQPLEILHLQPVDGVGAGAAHADELDGDVAVGEQRVLERKFVEVHGIGSGRCGETGG